MICQFSIEVEIQVKHQKLKCNGYSISPVGPVKALSTRTVVPSSLERGASNKWGQLEKVGSPTFFESDVF